MNRVQRQAAAESLRNEATVLRQTREAYKEARANIEEKLRVLAEREQTQSVIWQEQYQRALKEQLDTAIDALSTKNYANIREYLEGEYENGFIGTMYSLQKQGIPLAMPMNQKRVAKMVETTGDKIKLSKKLWGNSTKLKNAIRREVSIGFSSGESYQQVAARLSRSMQIDYNKSVRIARTEGGRVNNASRFDAMTGAKKHGADIVKQWDSTLDSRTRPEHMELEGQIAELEEPFKVGRYEGQYPHDFGVARMDVNCRCVVVERARWAVDGTNPEFEDYTKFDRNAEIQISDDGKSVSQIIDLSDAKNFKEFKKRYKEVERNLASKAAAAQIGVEVVGAGARAIEREAAVYQSLEREQVDAIAKFVETAENPKAAEVYLRYEQDFTLLNGKYRKGAHFTPDKVGVNLDVKATYADARTGSMATWFHEFGHHMDYISTGKGNWAEKLANGLQRKDLYASVKYADNKFGRTLAKEVDELVKQRQKELKTEWTKLADSRDFNGMRAKLDELGSYGLRDIDQLEEDGATAAEIKKSLFFKRRVGKASALEGIGKEVTELGDKAHGLQDIFQGASKGAIPTKWGHGAKYWKNSWDGVEHSALAKEAFAHFTSAGMAEGREVMDMLEKYLPESAKVYDEILDAILKGEI